MVTKMLAIVMWAWVAAAKDPSGARAPTLLGVGTEAVDDLRRALRLAAPEARESSGEDREEQMMQGTPEERALHGAMGAPHEGEGLESDVPSTLAEDSVEGNNAMASVKGLAKHVMMPCAGIFLICIIIGNALSISKYLSWIPESATTLGAAVILGLVIRHCIQAGFLSMNTFTFVNSTLLNLILLPIIIFTSGWSLRVKDFISQFEYILIFAILGTFISTFFIGYTLHYFSTYFGETIGHPALSIRECLCFASLISAVDPVATLATYSELGLASTQPLLNIMVFGESAINDAVAIVLFEVFNEGWEEFSYLGCAYQMSKLLFGSMIFGAIVSSALILLMRAARLPGHTSAELLYIWACGYFIFALCETVGFSGIIAVLFSGMLFGIYGRQHLNDSGSKLADEYLELCSKTADTGVFILCGTSVAMINSTQGVKCGLIGIVLCLVGRAISVSVCGATSNALKKYEGETHTLDGKTLFMMWHGGLRGGIALVLALELNAEWCTHKALFINATFIIICAFLLGLGSTTELLIHKFDFSTKEQGDAALIEPDRWYTPMFGKSGQFLNWMLVGTLGKKADPDGESRGLKVQIVPGRVKDAEPSP